MKISLLLIICLQLFEYGESNFLVEPKWTWEESCRSHPFALAPGNPKIKNKFDKSCVLTFQYPKQLNLDGENNADIEEARDFCKKMYPDHVIKPTWDRDIITCPYQRNRHCNITDSYPIGKYCVSVSTVAVNFEEAKNICKQRGGELISTGDKDVIHFYSRLYKWNQPTPAIWATGSDNKYQIFMGYSAIGNHRPGSSVIVGGETLKAKATVMCIGDSVSLPGAHQAVPYCKKFLNDFLKISSVESKGTCYYATQSLMVAKQNQNIATVDHFNTACKSRNGELNFAVAPISDEQRNALSSKYFKKKMFLLPGALAQYWGSMPNVTDKEHFEFTISRKTDAKTNAQVKIGVPAGGLWQYSTISTRGFMERAVLMWLPTDKKMTNVESAIRAPVMCGSGLNVVSQFKCSNGFQKAERDDYAICFKALQIDCPKLEEAQIHCKTGLVDINAMLAPMDSAEEEMAIVRAVTEIRVTQKRFSAMLGGWQKDYKQNKEVDKKPHIWQWDGTEVGNNHNGKYYRWRNRQPDRYRKCWWSGLSRTCQSEGCVSLDFAKGLPVGLNDVFCDDSCNQGHVRVIVCAVMATKVDL